MKNRGYLHELLVAEKDALVYNGEKAHSHTKANIIADQYSAVKEPEKYGVTYRSHVLTLMADLKVSEIYRRSLKDEFYNWQSLSCKPVDCSKILENYNKETEYAVIMTHIREHMFLSIVKDEIIPCFQNDVCIGDSEMVVAIDTDNINRALKYPPRDEEQGISFWSFSRQLRVYKNTYMRKYIDRVEMQLADTSNCEGILRKTRE